MEPSSVFNAKFVIDGLAMESTPFQLLDECTLQPSGIVPEGKVRDIIDETIDPAPTAFTFDTAKIPAYIHKINSSSGVFPMAYPAFGARRSVASALTECIWNKGHFGLDDIDLTICWKWDSSKIGNMASFYTCVDEACKYIYDLGVKVYDFSYDESGRCRMECNPDADECNGIDKAGDFLENDGEVSMGDRRKCPSRAIQDRESWVIYIPFDTCSFRLGGSALSALAGNASDSAPGINDPDYFQDCFEIVREMVEDGVALSGVGVGRGGLVCAAAKLCEKTGTDLDISGICSAYEENSLARILFGETPGVLLQIRDTDYDYLDSQCLLQDIAYYPVGHPGSKGGRINIKQSSKPAVSGILEALLRSREASEGED